jgi:hypothetical protein
MGRGIESKEYAPCRTVLPFKYRPIVARRRHRRDLLTALGFWLNQSHAVHERLVEQETDLSRRAVEAPRRLNLGREQVLARLWEIANLSPETTRGSITGQVKAISMIVAIEGLIPDRRVVSSEKKSAPPPTGQIYAAACLRKQQGKTIVPHPSPDLVRDEDSTARPACPGAPRSVPWGAPDPPPTCPGVPWSVAADAPSDLGPVPDPTLDPSERIFVRPFSPTEPTPSSPHARVPDSAPDKRVASSIEKNPSTWRLRL